MWDLALQLFKCGGVLVYKQIDQSRVRYGRDWSKTPVTQNVLPRVMKDNATEEKGEMARLVRISNILKIVFLRRCNRRS